MPKKKLNCHDWFDLVWSTIKTRQDNDVTNRTDMVYAKNEIELPWLIKLSPICDETRLDNDVTDHIGLVHAETEIELLRPILSGTIYDNDQME